jgi:L-asparaginase/Glu-tRNA(Gln) amidotransferase subunit D
MPRLPKVAVIGTGGTICSIGTGPFDILDYGANERMLHADALVAMFPEVGEHAEVIAVPFKAVPSPSIYFDDWKALVLTCDALVAEHPDLAGIVILHGTASLEETAYFLSLTVKVAVPVVVVGSQRPASALSTDAGMNLANAIRTAASPQARGLGVLVLLNDEIHAAREVTKTSTFRLQTFRSPDFGVPAMPMATRSPSIAGPSGELRRTPSSISARSRPCRASTSCSPTPARTARRRAPSSPPERRASSRRGSRRASPARPTSRSSSRLLRPASSLCSRPGPARAAPSRESACGRRPS